MIDFSMLDKDELKSLFESFDTDFLGIPWRSPTKSLNKYLPNGFRTTKLTRNMLIRMYCDAVKGNETSICRYVTDEISKNFNTVGISQYIETHNIITKQEYMSSVADISVILWENGMTIPAHIVLLLVGLKCDEEIKVISKSLHNAHNSAIEHAKLSGENHARKDLNIELQTIQDTADKTINKLQKKLVTLEEQRDLAQERINQITEQNGELGSELERSTELIQRFQKQSKSLKEEITILTDENNKCRQDKGLLNDTLREYDMQIKKLPELYESIKSLKSELEVSKKCEYSDEILKRLCSDIIDELRASSLGDKAILELAKNRFSANVSVEAAWSEISDFSGVHIKRIIDSISDSNLYATILDDVERIEDGVLIKFAVIKSLKSIIYNELERAESDRTIADRFLYNEE